MTFKKLRIGLSVAAVFGMAVLVVPVAFTHPSHDRDWKTEFVVLPKVAFAGDSMTIKNIRNFSYAADETVREASYYDGTYDLSTLTSIWYGISHFSGYGLAHTFLSFGFAGGKYLTISIEARQEVGESYHPLEGLLRRYEIMYVVADERDVIGLRTHVRGEKVYLYEINVGKKAATDVFLGMLGNVNEIYRNPRFYNTLTDNCTTNLLKYSRGLSWFDRMFNYRILLPGYSDELAYELGIIANDRPLADVRARARISPDGFAITDPMFSLKIRQP